MSAIDKIRNISVECEKLADEQPIVIPVGLIRELVQEVAAGAPAGCPCAGCPAADAEDPSPELVHAFRERLASFLDRETKKSGLTIEEIISEVLVACASSVMEDEVTEKEWLELCSDALWCFLRSAVRSVRSLTAPPRRENVPSA